jgi:uncharacterized protein YecE (DUF72 family)
MAGNEIYIGTSGWSYPKGEGTWNGYFYPADKKLDELIYYSRFFHTVEINSTFYRPPGPRMSQSWANRVPDGFLFAVKLWQKFTHPKMFEKATGEAAAVSQDDIILFKQSLEPLAAAGKLGVLLAQFPPSFTNNDFGKQVLQGLINHFRNYNLAVELRHKSWSDDPATACLLQDSNVAWVQIDEPKFSTSLAVNIPQTADFSYFRFHGRNREMWWKGDVETRYCYLYSPEETGGLAEKIKTASEKSKLTFVYFNNHWKAYAPRNATDIMRALEIPVTDLPLFQGQLKVAE